MHVSWRDDQGQPVFPRGVGRVGGHGELAAVVAVSHVQPHQSGEVVGSAHQGPGLLHGGLLALGRGGPQGAHEDHAVGAVQEVRQGRRVQAPALGLDNQAPLGIEHGHMAEGLSGDGAHQVVRGVVPTHHQPVTGLAQTGHFPQSQRLPLLAVGGRTHQEGRGASPGEEDQQQRGEHGTHAAFCHGVIPPKLR